jgi:hypothetical protein
MKAMLLLLGSLWLVSCRAITAAELRAQAPDRSGTFRGQPSDFAQCMLVRHADPNAGFWGPGEQLRPTGVGDGVNAVEIGGYADRPLYFIHVERLGLDRMKVELRAWHAPFKDWALSAWPSVLDCAGTPVE